MKFKKQSQRMIAAMLGCLSMGQVVYPCSTFMLPESEAKVMGKNFVWGVGHGQLTLNRRNMVKKAYLSDESGLTPHEWNSIYASLSFNQIAENFPMGGVNTEGLAVEILLAPTKTPVATEKPAINELQWIQLMLDRAASLDEAKEIAESVDIISDGDLGVHYHVCDRTGSCAVFEYLEGQLVISDEDTVGHNPVHVGNSVYGEVFPAESEISTDFQPAPMFDEKELLSLPTVEGATKEIPSIAQSTLESYDKTLYKDPLSESIAMYKILQGLSASPQWQIVYELANGVIHFRSEIGGDRRVYTVGFKDFSAPRDTDCREAIVKTKVGNRVKKFVDRQLSFDLANATAGKLMTPQNSSSSKPYQSGINSRPSSGTLSSQYSTGPAVKNPGSYQRSYEIAPSGSFGASNLNSSTASVRLALPDGLSPYVLSASDFSAKPYRLVEMSRAFLTSQVHLSNDVIEELSAYGSTHTRCAMSESKNNTEK